MFSGFYKKGVDERLRMIKEHCNLNDEEAKLLGYSKVGLDNMDRFIENVVGTFEFPIGIATNFLIDDKEYLIPMAIEESSVVAAASHGAKIAGKAGGFKTRCDPSLMIGQIQVVGAGADAEAEILSHEDEILNLANEKDRILTNFGGGARRVEVRMVNDFIVLHLIVDVLDAMGANTVNTMCEAVAPLIEKISGGKARLKIISNLSTKRLARASAIFPADEIGEDRVNGIIEAYEFANLDPYRACTHNKGIMNGIDAVALSIGQDFRAIEAGAHAYGSIGGYHSLTRWERTGSGDLAGSIELPLAVGTVGGLTKIHPIARIGLKIIGVSSARELAGVMASVGLAQNFAAMNALVKEGIQKGHMKLHAKNIAISAGAEGEDIERVASQMIEDGSISFERAESILSKRSP